MSDDTASIDAIVKALYNAVSFEAGGEPDYDRLRTLFLPGARLLPPNDDNMAVAPGDIEQFVEFSQSGLQASPDLREKGFIEREVARKTETFATIAHVFSTYEARYQATDAEPFARGINSIQLVRQAGRWWVLSMCWDDESPMTPIPAAHL